MESTEILKKDIIGVNAWSHEKKAAFFKEKLMSFGRDGMENIISLLDKSDFFTAPSSTIHHSNYNGGLLDHSLLVYSTAMELRAMSVKMNPELEGELDEECVAISALLHDICKICFYVEEQKWTKDSSGNWMSYISYGISDSFPIGHGEKSVIMLQMYGLKLKVPEMMAIRYHMGMWENMDMNTSKSYSRAIDKYPIITLIRCADCMSSLMFEDMVDAKKM